MGFASAKEDEYPPFFVVFQSNKENENYRVVMRSLCLRINLKEAVKPGWLMLKDER